MFMTKRASYKSALIILLSFLLFCTAFPLYFMVVSSLKSNFDLSINYFGLPAHPHFQYYADVFAKVGHYMWNSTVISGLSALGVVTVSSCSAYVFARFEFPMKNVLFFLLILFLMIPSILTLVPQFVLITRLGLINTPWACILPYVAGGQLVTIFVFRTFFEGIPKELFESIRMDGGTEFQAFWYLVIPFSLPILLSMALVNILTTWNDFVWPLLVLPSDKQTTFTVGLYQFMGQQQIKYGYVFAGMTLGAIPLMILFGFTMKYFVQGMTSGAIKA